MRVFERIGVWLWTFGKGVQPAVPVISNDELVTAYEWCAWPNDRLTQLPSTALRWVTWLGAPESVRATLHKLEASR